MILYEFSNSGWVSFKELLGLTPTTICNLEKGGLKKLIGNRTKQQLSSLFKKTWDGFSEEDQFDAAAVGGTHGEELH